MTDVISGNAYGARATLEVSGEALTWRARPDGELPENICTSVHDVRDSHWIEQRISVPGMVLVGVGAVWIFMYGILEGAFAIAVGVALLVWRHRKPRRMLILDVGSRRLVMNVDGPSAANARALAARIDRAIATGEVPSSPPTLP
ncbi:MAG: hypothetical protein M4D80_14880 [Myxococcota bacterium]|nr:hypothetical protein [Deltaproteobacteria bacterium]MDQ3336450.1 hypothetical protein [Myxococcota bacterium]